jgi:hypothetical protein
MTMVNDQLMDAVARHDPQAVRECLERGADANYFVAMENPDDQPTTPLRMVMFRISDSLLTDADLDQCAAITRLLLRSGADPRPALQLAERRYGRYDPDQPPTPFMRVWHIVANTAYGVPLPPPALQPLDRTFIGDDLDEAIEAFEKDRSEEAVDTTRILSSNARGPGVVAHYEVRYYYSVLYDTADGSYESWVLVVPDGKRFRLVAATPEHHMR